MYLSTLSFLGSWAVFQPVTALPLETLSSESEPDTQASCSAPGECESCRVAVLLVSRSMSNKCTKHAEATVEYILDPLRADALVVVDYEAKAYTEFGLNLPPTSMQYLVNAIPPVFGDRLKLFGLIGGESEDLPSPFVNLPPEPPKGDGPDDAPKVGNWQQWYKVWVAWGLLEERERELGFKYDVVIKARSDSTPIPAWSPQLVCAQANAPKPLRLYAATDHVFWGPRDSFAPVAQVYPALKSWFLGSRKIALQRPFDVEALLRSMLAMIPIGFKTTGTWNSANKPNMVYFPRGIFPGKGDLTASPQTMIKNLQAVHKQGWRYIDPMVPSTDPKNATPPMEWPKQTGKGAYRGDSNFCTETSFLMWLFANNVTVCDLGTGTDQILYKVISRMLSAVYFPSFTLKLLVVMTCLS